METKLVMTPSGLNDSAERGIADDDVILSVSEGSSRERPRRDSSATPQNDRGAALLGSLVHRFLERWDFSCEKCSMPLQLRSVANHYLASLGLLVKPFPDPKEGKGEENPPELVALVEEAQRLLADFIDSEDYDEIKKSIILGREVPFFYTSKSGTLMRGAMDILYRLPSGQLIVGDYKTDLNPEANRYAAQGAAYTEAVSRALGEKALFKALYLRKIPTQL
jgi:ATP-dependent exoDNAse (exonuclease V) beta subunit